MPSHPCSGRSDGDSKSRSGDAKYYFARGLDGLSLTELVELVHVRWVTDTADATALAAAIGGIAQGGPSTNLYGALVTGLGSWSNTFNWTALTYGALVVITDGSDTAGVKSLNDVLNARNGREVFAIAVGSGADVATLDTITDGWVYTIADYPELGAALADIGTELATYRDGLYYLYYASTKRTGTHTLEVSIANNDYQGGWASASGTFSANGFTSVSPQVLVRGPSEISGGQTASLQAYLRWMPRA